MASIRQNHDREVATPYINVKNLLAVLQRISNSTRRSLGDTSGGGLLTQSGNPTVFTATTGDANIIISATLLMSILKYLYGHSSVHGCGVTNTTLSRFPWG